MKLFNEVQITGFKFKWLDPCRIGHIDSVPNSTVKALAAPIPALKDANVLTEEAIQLAALLHPPILSQPDPETNLYAVIGNLRTIEVCRRLPSGSRIPAIIVSTSMNTITSGDFYKLETFLSSVWFGLDVSTVHDALLCQIKELPPRLLSAVSPEFSTRSGIERSLGLNRRRAAPSRSFAKSPISQQSLKLNGESSDV